MEELENVEKNKPLRDEKGRLLPGQTANPNGRPKGKSLKEFAREWYMSMTDEEKKAYVEKVEERIPGFAWRMAEGNPHQTSDAKHEVELPQSLIELLKQNGTN